ncbi:g6381 [Coccomyxa viridis]|uniref:G6381 protein n=1 Tax=Coccomyxa viridis TaxID=1274662 RepID=A0ABP1FVA1_9CHLO
MPYREETFQGNVQETAATVEDMLKELGPKRNPDKSHRLIPAAKMVGEGIYVIFNDFRHGTVRLLTRLYDQTSLRKCRRRWASTRLGTV